MKGNPHLIDCEMKNSYYVHPLHDCLDIIIWVDVLNGEAIASVDFVELLRAYYCPN